jgi:hypothetical protein
MTHTVEAPNQTTAERTERRRLARKLTEWRGIVDDLYNTKITTPSGVEIFIPMVIGAACEIEAWAGWHIEVR